MQRTRTLHTMTCAVCNEPFEARRNDAVTCSPKCRQRRHIEHKARELALAMTSATDVLASLAARANMTPDD